MVQQLGRAAFVMATLWIVGCATPGKESACLLDQTVDTPDGEQLVADCYPGTGPAIVFVHGWSQSRDVWQHQVEAFAGSNTVITYDLRGHGDSTRPSLPSSYRGEWTPATDLEAVLSRFAVDEFFLVGWSFGAIVASNATVYLGPDRVKGLVLVAGAMESGTDRVTQNFGPLFAELAPLTTSGPRDEEMAAVHRFLQDSYLFGDWPSALYERVFAANVSLSPLERATVAERPSQTFIEEVNRLNIPVALIHGEDDPIFSADSSVQTDAELQQSILIIYERTGHWPFIEQASRFNADLKQFVDEQGRP
ncbi:MAG: alpha/beta hydrolase [Pseudomonadota bacterium]